MRSFGQFGIQIADSQKFLVKLVGNLAIFDKDTLIQYFRGLYLTKAKDAISSYLIHNKVSVLEINAYIDELSKDIMEKIQPVLSEYGIELLNFHINDISIPENDPAAEKLKNALAKKAEMEIIGYNYQQERSLDTLEGAAKNPGSSVFVGILLIYSSKKYDKILNNFYKYSAHFSTDPTNSIDLLAQTAGISVDKAKKNITMLINFRLFKSAYIDRDCNCPVFPEMSPDNSYVNPSGSPSTQPAHTVTIQCTGCGATNEVAAGKTGKCEYCGSSISA